MKTALKVLRFIVALPIALPLLLIGALLMRFMPKAGALGLLGLWLLGVEMGM